MKASVTTLILSLLICPSFVYPQQLELINTFEEHIYSPSVFYVLGEDTILTVEQGNKDGVLSLIDLKNNEVLNARRAGMGPGEFSQNGLKYITETKDGSIWVWDGGHRRGTLFERNLDYITDIKIDDHTISSALYVNDTTVVAKKLYENQSIVGLYPMEKYRVKSPPYFGVNAYDYTPFVPFSSNPLLNQGAIITDHTGKAFAGFLFGSTVINLHPNDGWDTLATPYYHPFPEVKSNSGYMMPDHAKEPQTTLSLSSDSSYIYLLYSGEKFDDSLFKQIGNMITGKMAEALEKSNTATKVFVFDQNNRQFITEFNLPVRSKRIFRYKDWLYTLSYDEGRYRIMKYEFKL